MIETFINAHYVSQMTVEGSCLYVWLNGRNDPSAYYHSSAEEAKKTASMINERTSFVQITVDQFWNVKEKQK